MADLVNMNNNLTIMRLSHQKQVAETNMTARQIRILELTEEIARCQADIEAQQKVIAEQEKNIQIQLQAEKEKVTAQKSEQK
jgi:hypothetical protein